MPMFCACLLVVGLLLKVALCQLTPVGTQHIEAVVNSPATISCRTHTSSQPIRWQYIVPGNNRPLMVYDGSVIHKESRGRIEVKFNSETGQSNLTIKSVQLNDSGQYQCLEMNNNAHRISFNVTVVRQPTAENGIATSTENAIVSTQRAQEPAAGVSSETGFVVIFVSAIFSAVGVCLSAAAFIGVLHSRRKDRSKRATIDAANDAGTAASSNGAQRVESSSQNEPAVATEIPGVLVAGQLSAETQYNKLQSATLEPPRQPSQYDELTIAHHNYVNVMELIGTGVSG